MKIARHEDKPLVTEILSQSFKHNQSIKCIIKQDKKSMKRLRALMDYCFEVCLLFGEVFLSDDRKACALILYPHQKRTTLKSIWLDFKLLVQVIGLSGVAKSLKRESKIKEIQPNRQMAYLWFVGVNPLYQHSGNGSRLLKEIIDHAQEQSLPVYLETSTLKNLPWYKHFGFTIYDELELGYTLHFLKHEIVK